jgi:hypothetical protein
MSPLGRISNGLGGGSVRFRNLAALQHVCIHPMYSNPCANSAKTLAFTTTVIGPRAKIFHICMFFMAF